MPWNFRSAFTYQKIEIDTLIRLQDVIKEQPVPSPRRGFWWDPLGFASREFFVGHFQMKSPFRDIELNHISGPDQGERSACRRFRGNVEHDRAKRGATHPAIRNAYNIGDAFAQ